MAQIGQIFSRRAQSYIINIVLAVVFLFALNGCSKTALQKLTDQASGHTSSVKEEPDWQKSFTKDPKNSEYAIQYAKSLSKAGDKKKAFRVLRTGLRHNPEDEKMISEYGRMAIKLNKFNLAEKTLRKIEAPKDWRVLSAKGTIYAKRGDHKKAQTEFVKALEMKPTEPSVLNNLALSYALSGNPSKAEKLLREIIKNGQATDKIKQNLVLVLSLQGRFDDAEKVAKTAMSKVAAREDIDYFKKFIKKPIKSKQPKDTKKLVTAATLKVAAKKPVKVAKKKVDSKSKTKSTDKLRGKQKQKIEPEFLLED